MEYFTPGHVPPDEYYRYNNPCKGSRRRDCRLPEKELKEVKSFGFITPKGRQIDYDRNEREFPISFLPESPHLLSV
ncbi:MAG: hypothetical protein R2727_10165 [Bacteroidales bacterium]